MRGHGKRRQGGCCNCHAGQVHLHAHVSPELLNCHQWIAALSMQEPALQHMATAIGSVLVDSMSWTVTRRG
jgi:hypothetical protein